MRKLFAGRIAAVITAGAIAFGGVVAITTTALAASGAGYMSYEQGSIYHYNNTPTVLSIATLTNCRSYCSHTLYVYPVIDDTVTGQKVVGAPWVLGVSSPGYAQVSMADSGSDFRCAQIITGAWVFDGTTGQWVDINNQNAC